MRPSKVRETLSKGDLKESGAELQLVGKLQTSEAESLIQSPKT